MKKLTLFLIALLLFSMTFSKVTDTVSKTSVDDHLAVSASRSSNILDRAIFFGDSTTYGLFRYNINNQGEHGSNYHTLKPSQIWVPKDGTFYLGNLLTARIALSDGRQLTLSEACSAVRPEILIITVGINGLTTWTKESFFKYYEKMLDIVHTASPKSTVILQSVYPTAENKSPNLSDFTCDKIDGLNAWIKEIAQDRALLYLDTASVLKDETGNLFPHYHNGDGLHLNTQGFNAVLEYIEKHVIL